MLKQCFQSKNYHNKDIQAAAELGQAQQSCDWAWLIWLAAGYIGNTDMTCRAMSSFLGALCQEMFGGPWNKLSILAA